MGGYAPQHDRLPRRKAEPPRRSESPQAAPVVRYQYTPGLKGNGEMVRDLAASPHESVPSAAGNGMRVMNMPEEVITARAPDQPAGQEAQDAALDAAQEQPVIGPDDAPSEQGAKAAAPEETNAAQAGAAAPAQSAQPTDARKDAKVPGDDELDDEAARQEDAAEESEAEAGESGVIELDAQSAPDAAKKTARAEKMEADERAPNPRVIVQRWQGGVSKAGGGMSRPSMAGVAGGPARVTGAADKANTDRRQKTQNVAADAVANVPETPKVPEPPPPPQSDPIPEYTAAIQSASNRKLEDAQLPELQQSEVYEVTPGGLKVGGNFPRLGDQAVPNKLFQLLMTEGAEATAKIPEDPKNPEREKLEKARAQLQEPFKEKETPKEGENAPLKDTGPQGIKPLPAGAGTPVGQVIARLLASLDKATSDVLVRLRRIAYPKGVLFDNFPDIGATLAGKVAPRMNSELREIATAAGVSGTQLDTMVGERKKELEKQVADAQKALDTSNEKANESVAQTGQEALDAIEGARQMTDEEIIQRQEAASGGNDPTVINARRDLVIRWVRTHVNRQTTNYQKAGEKREKELNTGQYQRTEAINALAQREEYRGLHPSAPTPAYDRSKPDISRQLADFVANLRAGALAAVEKIKKAIRPFFTKARDDTKANRAAVEKSGNEAIDAARLWAEDRILEGQSWWERFKAKLGRWFGDAQKSNEQWCVERTEETRDGIVKDQEYLTEIQQKVAQGATKEQLLQNDRLTEEQRSVITEFFAQPAGAHPLDIAAAALRQRLARQYLDVAKPVFETELLAQEGDNIFKSAEVAHVARPSFSAPKIAQEIHAQLDNFDSDEAVMLKSLEGLSAFEGSLLRRVYQKMFGVDMDWAMNQAFDSDESDQAKLRLEGKGAAADAAALDDAFGIINTDEKAIMDLLRGRSVEEIEEISKEYERRYGKPLNKALLDNLDEGNEQNQAKALVEGNTAVADSIALDEAMRGGLTGWGTEEEEIEATYKRVHDEVHALAQREGWSSEQMKAEVRRRLGLIEKDFEKRYENVEQYNEPGLAGQSRLRRAFSSEMDPGPERDLANAFADDDMVKADAARIEIERRGVWASDEAINKVLTNQYERALQDTRLDEGPARKMIVDRRRAELLRKNPQITENELSIEIMKLERDMDREMGEEAQKRSNVSMEALNDAYQKKYFYPLSYTIEANMSGVDREKARALHKQGGRLTALQEVDYATKGDGTDEDALRSRIGGMTKGEIDKLAVEWARTHNGEDLRKVLAGELSGRDASDILDMYDNGAPESAKQRIAQEQRRVDRELGELTGVLGGAAAGKEADYLNFQMTNLSELNSKLDRRDLSDDERELLREQLDYRVELVQEGVEDHRRAIDSVANFAAQVASMVVAVAVGAALTFLSGGTLGPVMIAVIASVAATVTTMGTKALIQGGSYGIEDVGVDIAIGVVDALTAAATAGMGGKILRGATGAAEGAAARAANPTRLTRLLGKMGGTEAMQAVGRSRAGQAASKVVSGLNKMESGFLTRGIKGQNVLARMFAKDNQALKFIAEGLAEGIENAVAALPTSLAGTAINDKTWEGNPLLNLATGTFEGVKGGVALGGAMHGAKGLKAAAHAASPPAHLATPEGRLKEANRILNEAREQHRAKNPEATNLEFLDSPEGQRAKAEVEKRGLIGEQRKPAKAEELADSKEAPRAETLPPAEAVPHAAARSEPALTVESAPKVEPVPKAEPVPHPDAARRADAKPEPTRRPAAETPAAREGEPGAHPEKVVDPATQQLREGLPKSLTDRVDVKVNPDLDGNTVNVIPDPRGPGHGVRVEVGPHATPTDVLLHAHTIQTMQRYKGLLGKLRQLHDWFTLTTVGSAGWEAKLELEKLPGIIHERMQRLAEGNLTPEATARIVDEINHLSGEIDRFQKVLDNPELRDAPGRGFVAMASKKTGEKVPGVREDEPPRTADALAKSKLSPVHDSPLNDKHSAVYQIEHEWQENGRIYRRVMVDDASGRIERVREEIQLLDDVTGKPNGKWVQRGSEASGGAGMGVVGEAASRLTIERGEFGGMKDREGRTDTKEQRAAQQEAKGRRRVQLPEEHLRNGSNNGFDGAFLRINHDGTATMVLVEAKNQPSGLSLESFTAIKGEQFLKNLEGLREKLSTKSPEELGIDPEDHAAMVKALNGRWPKIEVQVHTTPETHLGHPENPSSSILKDLEDSVNDQGIPGKRIKVVHVPMNEKVTQEAKVDLQKRDAIGERSVRLRQLAGEGVNENSPEFHRAQSMMLAEQSFTRGVVEPRKDGRFVDEAGVIFEVIKPSHGGSAPTAPEVAQLLIAKLDAAAKAGQLGKRRFILDLDDLPANVQRDVLELMRENPKVAKRAQNILIHDRANSEMMVFNPKDAS